MRAYARGDNYEFTLRQGLAYLRVWSRPDLDREAGARLAREEVDHHRRLTQLSRRTVQGLVFDLSEAPPAWGPATEAALMEMVGFWELAQRKIGFVSHDPLQRVLLRQVVRAAAPNVGRIYQDRESAELWAKT
ncbi:MAG: hypothetical protein U0263_36795 [Polyangiaceae bacterium]